EMRTASRRVPKINTTVAAAAATRLATTVSGAYIPATTNPRAWTRAKTWDRVEIMNTNARGQSPGAWTSGARPPDERPVAPWGPPPASPTGTAAQRAAAADSFRSGLHQVTTMYAMTVTARITPTALASMFARAYTPIGAPMLPATIIAGRCLASFAASR